MNIEQDKSVFYIPCSLGEAVDRLTILEIKLQHCKDELQKRFLLMQHDYIASIVRKNDQAKRFLDDEFNRRLKEIHRIIWDAENAIRKETRLEHKGIIVNHICQLNDERARIKNNINKQFCPMTEEDKIYQ